MDTLKHVPAQFTFAAEKMKKVNLFTTERMFCDVYCFEPGQAQTPHTHTGSDKVYYVLEGNGRVQVGAETKDVGPGDITLAPSGSEHGFRNPGPGRLTVLVFMAPKP